jgi:hypothetical protein
MLHEQVGDRQFGCAGRTPFSLAAASREEIHFPAHNLASSLYRRWLPFAGQPLRFGDLR